MNSDLHFQLSQLTFSTSSRSNPGAAPDTGASPFLAVPTVVPMQSVPHPGGALGAFQQQLLVRGGLSGGAAPGVGSVNAFPDPSLEAVMLHFGAQQAPSMSNGNFTTASRRVTIETLAKMVKGSQMPANPSPPQLFGSAAGASRTVDGNSAHVGEEVTSAEGPSAPHSFIPRPRMQVEGEKTAAPLSTSAAAERVGSSGSVPIVRDVHRDTVGQSFPLAGSPICTQGVRTFHVAPPPGGVLDVSRILLGATQSAARASPAAVAAASRDGASAQPAGSSVATNASAAVYGSAASVSTSSKMQVGISTPSSLEGSVSCVRGAPLAGNQSAMASSPASQDTQRKPCAAASFPTTAPAAAAVTTCTTSTPVPVGESPTTNGDPKIGAKPPKAASGSSKKGMNNGATISETRPGSNTPQGPASTTGTTTSKPSDPKKSSGPSKQPATAAAASPTAGKAAATAATSASLYVEGPVSGNMLAKRPIIRTTKPTSGRVIVVGDIHGCPEQLDNLIAKVGFVKGKDVLIIAGDYVNKGPDSVTVVRRCMELGAIGVLGNHDYTLLSCINRIRKRFSGVLPACHRSDPVMCAASTFPSECEEYLRGLPHILRVPQMNLIVVHAGFDVSRRIEDQDVYEIMNMRRLAQDGNGGVKAMIKEKEGVLWGSLWKGPELVVFGHDALTSLQVHSNAIGIDTGCVYGDRLTCIVFDGVKPEWELVSVDGLSLSANIICGLPPPTSATYEESGAKASEELRIFRLPTRATPSVAGGSGSATFLSTPIFSSQQLANQVPSPTGNSQLDHRFADVGEYSVQSATLLALSRAYELPAIATLLAEPCYASAWEPLLANSSIISTFWLPFTRQLLDGMCTGRTNLALPSVPYSAAHSETGSPRSGSNSITGSVVPSLLIQSSLADEVVQMVCEICEEHEEVFEAVKKQLVLVHKLAGERAIALNKGSRKAIALLVHDQV